MRLLVPPARVLVRLPSWLGDAVACEPVLCALHARWQAAGRAERLTFVAPTSFVELLESRFAGVRWLPAARGATPDARTWRGHDVALLLDGSWRSAWTAWRSGIPARAGFASGGRTPLLTFALRPALERGGVPLGLGRTGRAPRRLPRPFASACAELAGLLGLEVRERSPLLEPGAQAQAAVRARLELGGIAPGAAFVLVNAGARPGSAKGADPRVLAALARRPGLPIVLACGPGEEANARATAAELRGDRALLLDDPPPALPDLFALIATASWFVTSDSGPRHLAQAVRARTLVLCGPTDPRHTAEHGDRIHVARVELACSPCHREVCPLEGEAHHACMRTIDPERVWAAGTSVREIPPSR